jgi:hypothetical protein
MPEGEGSTGAARWNADGAGKLEVLVADVGEVRSESIACACMRIGSMGPAAAAWYTGTDYAAEYSKSTLKPFVDESSCCANCARRCRSASSATATATGLCPVEVVVQEGERRSL